MSQTEKFNIHGFKPLDLVELGGLPGIVQVIGTEIPEQWYGRRDQIYQYVQVRFYGGTLKLYGDDIKCLKHSPSLQTPINGL